MSEVQYRPEWTKRIGHADSPPFTRERFNPLEVVASLFGGITWNCEPFVRYVPDLEPQYRIRRQQRHDGLCLFTNDFILQAMRPLLDRDSFYVPLGPCPPGHEAFYEVGDAKLISTFGRVEVPAGIVNGVRERIVIPVRCTFRPQ